MQKSASVALLQTEADGRTGAIYTLLSVFNWEAQIITQMKLEGKKPMPKGSGMLCITWNTAIRYF